MLKKWVKNLSFDQFSKLRIRIAIGGTIGCLLSIAILQNWYVWGAFLAVQFAPILFAKWRRECETCTDPACDKH